MIVREQCAVEAGNIRQQLRALHVLPEELDLGSSTHIEAYSS